MYIKKNIQKVSLELFNIGLFFLMLRCIFLNTYNCALYLWQQDNSYSTILLSPRSYELPYSTFLAPCALNFFRVAANFLSIFFFF